MYANKSHHAQTDGHQGTIHFAVLVLVQVSQCCCQASSSNSVQNNCQKAGTHFQVWYWCAFSPTHVWDACDVSRLTLSTGTHDIARMQCSACFCRDVEAGVWLQLDDVALNCKTSPKNPSPMHKNVLQQPCTCTAVPAHASADESTHVGNSQQSSMVETAER